MKLLLSTLFLVGHLGLLYSNTTELEYTFEWAEQPLTFEADGQTLERYTFKGAMSSERYPQLPFLIETFPVNFKGRLRVQVIRASYEPFSFEGPAPTKGVQETIDFEAFTSKGPNGIVGKISFTPIIRKGNAYERLTYVKLRVELLPGGNNLNIASRDPVDVSVLSEGDIYKIAVREDGVYRLSYDFLKDELGIDIDNVDPRTIKLYGNGGGMVPELPSVERIDDLQENAILVSGESDGNFDGGDFILFYGQGPNEWAFNEDSTQFNFIPNIYDTRNFYFIKVGGTNGQRISSQPSLPNSVYTTTTFSDFAALNEEKVNIFHDFVKTQGGGQIWYGDHFKVARDYQYDFDFPNLDASAPVKVTAAMILQSSVTSRFNVTVNGQTLQSSTAPRITTGIDSDHNGISQYANWATIDGELQLSSDNFDVTVEYPNLGQSQGWLDYVQFNVRRELSMVGNQMHFRDLNSMNFSSTTYQLSNINNSFVIWDISNPLAPKLQEVSSIGNTFSFGANSSNLRTYIAYNPQDGLLAAEAVGAVPNQNLHGIRNIDMLIIYPTDFQQEAARLAEHRRTYNGLTVELVDVNHIWNEFGSGRKDAAAIRDFVKTVYERDERLKYLLLFGDGSFDARDIYGLGNDYIPVFEAEGLNPIFSYPTDDFFVIFEASSTNVLLRGDMSVAVGRLPINTPDQARAAVDKIIKYDNDPKSFRDWRNRMVYVGDDEDGFIHAPEANQIANLINSERPPINNEKIFLDAFPQIATPGGDRFPSATNAINNAIFKGALTITYLGHGGSQGWAQERVLNISDINSWNNSDRLPVFVTATCSFAGYDDAGFTTAGELVFLNENGGAISLLTTVRAVFANQNATLTEGVLRKMYQFDILDRPLTFGEIMQYAKNELTSSSTLTNSRKFALLGDPAQTLAVPRFKVATTKIGGIGVTAGSPDTLRALQQVVIEGLVTDENGAVLDNFNGIIYPTIFDKETINFTLGQDEGSPVFDYNVQKNVIFRGRVSVTDGRFSFTCVVPRDINYQFGIGKINYYAADEGQLMDAAGSYNVIIGGTDSNAISDDEGPRVEVYMNTPDFVFGGITDPDPTLLVVLEDDNGINVVGNSIGHDLEGVLDNNTQNTYLLNDFYESNLDDFTKGEVRFPLSDIEEGRHEIRVKAWDTANNSSEGYTEFVVASSENVALEHVLNYPNPFTDRTCFQFDHNLANQELEVLISIYTVSGRLVKTIDAVLLSDGAIRQDDCIEWDGRDDYGGQLARGVYLYKVQVRAANTGTATLSGESEFEKLVILK